MGDEGRNYEDRRLERLLQARADGEPRAGLEERVLARIASEPPRRVFALWPTLAAVSALVVIAIALIVLHTETPKQHLAVQNSQEKPTKPSEDTPSLRASVTNREAQKHRRQDSGNAQCCTATKTATARRDNGNQDQLPKLATFPAPQPETEQERMLGYLATKIRGLNQTQVSTDSTNVARLEDLSVPEFTIHAMEEEPPVNDNPRK
jgi:hypothetical protein